MDMGPTARHGEKGYHQISNDGYQEQVVMSLNSSAFVSFDALYH
jgi:hypothetical protein